MEPEEFYLTFDGKLSKEYLPFSPYTLPWASNFQCIVLISLFYKEAIELQEIIKIAGHKMNDHALDAFKQEIEIYILDMKILKANIEN